MDHHFAELEADVKQIEQSAPPVRRVAAPLVVGAANDLAEVEADRVADEVISRLQSGENGESHVHDGCHGIARTEAPAAGGPEVGYAGGEISDDLSSRIESRRGQGSALPSDVLQRMESGFGRSLAAVRVHTDGESAQLNRAVSARAFTTGNDIFFGAGEYSPGTAAGERVLAHELAHTQQQGGGARRVNRLMWTKKKLLEETYEGAFTRMSSAQKDLATLVEEYKKSFEGNGVVSPDKVSSALSAIALMEQIATTYLAKHTTVDKNGGESKDETRKRRMAGFEKFKEHLTAERTVLQQIETGFTPGGGLAGGTALVVEGEAHKTLKAKYGRAPAATTFEKLGDHIASLVGPNESASIEVEVEFPADPSGVSFVGAIVKAEVENDGGKTVQMKAELKVTGGAKIGVAEIKGELGGYITAQGKTGRDCMNLMSYELYRRGRESHVIPHEVVSVMWGGGGTGKFAFDKTEAWSRDLETQMWGQGAPKPEDFDTTAEYEAAHDAWAAGADDTFVESGVSVGAAAKVGVKSSAAGVSAEASIGGTSGRRIDYTSLKNRKGGAGAKNRGSDSAFATGMRGAFGEDRGAQKNVGRSVSSFKLGGKVAANVGTFAVSAGVGLEMKWMHDGSHAGPDGKHTPSELQKAELTVSGEFTVPAVVSTVGGAALDKTMKQLSANLADWLKKPAIGAVVAGAPTPESAQERVRAVSQAADMQKASLAHENLAALLSERILDAAGADTKSTSTYSIDIGLDMTTANAAEPKSVTWPRYAEITLKKKSGLEIEVPSAVKIKVEKSKRLVKLSFDPNSGWLVK